MDSNIPYIVERMTLADVAEVAALEKMIFSMPWSAHAFEYELQYNPMAYFFVVRLRNLDISRGEGHDSHQQESKRPSPCHVERSEASRNTGETMRQSCETSSLHPEQALRSAQGAEVAQHSPPKGQPTDAPRVSTQRKILGYGGFWLILDEAHICTLGVHPDWRRRGIGELLLTHLIDQAIALHAAVLTLEVRVSNLAAQKLYQKYGFMVAGLRKRYYSDNNEDALIMTTQLITSLSFQRRFHALKAALQRKLTSQLTQVA